MNPVQIVYLLCYNIVSCAGWLLIFLLITIHIVKFGLSDLHALWGMLDIPLKVMQTSMLLDLIHSIVGIYKPSIKRLAPQVLSRLVLVWTSIQLPVVHSQPAFIMMLLSWCLIDSSRYYYHILFILNMISLLTVRIRFSFFLNMYPIAVLLELYCVYIAYDYKTTNNEADFIVDIFKLSEWKLPVHIVLISTIILYLFSPKIFMDMNRIYTDQVKKLVSAERKRKLN